MPLKVIDNSPILSGGAGKRVCRYIVGTSTSGWTKDDCDYLCDGIADDVEINQAIQALPAGGGGEIVILDGTYNITGTISINKNNITLCGTSNNTILKRVTESQIVSINITSSYGCVQYLSFDGARDIYNENLNYCVQIQRGQNNIIAYNFFKNVYGYGVDIYGDSNIIIGNNFNNNIVGIRSYSNYNIIISNICNGCTTGIKKGAQSFDIIYGNVCCNNKETGISVNGYNNVVIGNICKQNENGIYVREADNNIISNNNCSNNSSAGIYFVIAKYSTVSSNICNNNTYGIYANSGTNNCFSENSCNNNTIGLDVYFINNSNVVANSISNNTERGIHVITSSGNIFGENICKDNDMSAISLISCSNSIISNNVLMRGTGLTTDYTSAQYTLILYGDENTNNIITENIMMGKNYFSYGGTGNTFVNNKYN